MHDLIPYHSMEYVVTLYGVNCCIIVLKQCKCNNRLYHIYLISINVSNMITVVIFKLIIYIAFNFSWIKNTNADLYV
jgi:hypothetical protein